MLDIDCVPFPSRYHLHARLHCEIFTVLDEQNDNKVHWLNLKEQLNRYVYWKMWMHIHIMNQ